MSGGDFDLYLSIIVYFAVIWLAGRISREFSISPIIGEIFAGVALGPNMLQLVPYMDHADDDEHHTEEIWKVLGQFGVALMICESGTHIHFKKLKEVGAQATIVAIIGTFFPLLLGMAFFKILGEEWLPSFAVGCALAPTSVGIALQLLAEANQLNSTPGQTIVAAAFLDDIFSLVLLVIVVNLTGEISVGKILLPFFACFSFLFVGAFIAAKIMPTLVPSILARVNEVSKRSYQPRDEIHLGMMIGLLILFSWITSYLGSHLLGAFVAGMCFCEVPRSMYIWRSQMKRISSWLIRLFFAATVAFQIPVEEMMEFDAFYKGVILAFIPTIGGKVAAGVFSGKWKWVIGFAMVGRGEFAYLVADNIVEKEIVTTKVYAICVWALVLAVIAGPVLFKIVLDLAFRDKIRSGIKCFEINASGQHHNNIHFELVDTLHHLSLDVLEATVETDGQVDVCKFIVSCAGNDDLDRDMITEIRHDIVEALNDPEAQVNLAAHDQDLAYADKNIVEVRVMSQHHPTILPQILNLFLRLKLEVLKVHTEDHLDVDTDIFFLQQTENEGSVDLAVIRYGLRDIFHQHNEKCEVMVKRVDAEKMHSVKKTVKATKSTENSTARRLLDAQGEGYSITFSLKEDTQPAFLRDICSCLSELDLDVTAIDFEELHDLPNGAKGASHFQGIIHTRDLRILNKEKHKVDEASRIHEMRQALANICATNASSFSVVKKSGNHETPQSVNSTSKNPNPKTRPARASSNARKWTRRLTAIGSDGLAIPNTTSKSRKSNSKVEMTGSAPIIMGTLQSINRTNSRTNESGGTQDKIDPRLLGGDHSKYGKTEPENAI